MQENFLPFLSTKKLKMPKSGETHGFSIKQTKTLALNKEEWLKEDLEYLIEILDV